jgi:hypothetical protein
LSLNWQKGISSKGRHLNPTRENLEHVSVGFTVRFKSISKPDCLFIWPSKISKTGKIEVSKSLGEITMVQENEIVMLLLGVGVLIFTVKNHVHFKRLPACKILTTAFYVLFGGWVLTVIEGFFWNELLNLFEHICYCASSVLVAAWCWKVFGIKKETQ